MSIAERNPSELLVACTMENRDGRNEAPRQTPVGCRLARALAGRFRGESAEPAIWAVGSVTVDDLSRFARG
jgi:hypothetical protein